VSSRSRRPETLADLLRIRAEEHPSLEAFVFLAGDKASNERLTYRGLAQRAATIAAELSEIARVGDRAVLVYPAGLEFVAAFFGCAYAGVAAVPVVSPLPGGLERTLRALRAIVSDCDPCAILTTDALRHASNALATEAALGGCPWIATDALDRPAAGREPVPTGPDTLAYLQYTSGSTASPRGVMVQHAHVLGNLEVARAVSSQTPESVCVTWLPHYHDMGLASLLGSVYVGHPCVFMSPLSFISAPLRWLRAISDHRGTWAGSPSSALELCVRGARPSDLEDLDLASVEWLAVGAEPIRAETLERFASTFASAGFRREALAPCYGLAECVVFATGSRAGSTPRIVRFDVERLHELHAAEATPQARETRSLVSSGVAWDGHEVAVVDPETRRRLEPGHIGEIWVHGPSVAAGYWRDPAETRASFGATIDGGDGPFLRTGDLGFLREGELFVTGRLKDLIVIAGANHYPHDIELTVERCHPAIKAGGSAAFAVAGDVSEHLVVMAEVRRNAPLDDIRGAIYAAVAEEHRLTVDGLGLMLPRAAPKTTSGKIRRQACRSAWFSGALPLLARWESARLRATEPEPEPPTKIGSDGPPAPEQLEIEAALLDRIVGILGERAGTIDPGVPLRQLGLGSLEVAEVRAALADDFGIEVPLSRMLDGWSIRDIAREAAGGTPRKHTARPSATRFERYVNPALGGRLRRFRFDKVFVRGKGCWLYDDEGHSYLDAIAGFGAVPFGHNPPEIWQAIEAVAQTGEPTFVQPSSLHAAGELAERLVELAPRGLDYVAFTNSGAESTEAAIRIARTATGKPGILSTAGGFHGEPLDTPDAAEHRAHQDPPFMRMPSSELVPFGDVAQLERVLAERADRLAAFIVEPIQGEGGIVEPPAGYLRAAGDLCARHGVVFVVDEVQTGLGRTGALFACDDEGVHPDVLLLAKALGGGLVPIGAVLYSDGVYSDKFALEHMSTFAGGALAARVGLAVLDLLTRDDRALLEHVRTTGETLRRRLEEATSDSSLVRSVRGRGFLLGLELAADRGSFRHQSLLALMGEQGHLAALLSSHLLNVERVRVAPAILSSNVIRVEPSLTFTEAMCDKVADAAGRAIGLVSRGNTAAVVNHLLNHPRALQDSARQPRRRSAPARRETRRGGRWAFVAHPIEYESYADFDASLGLFSSEEIAELCGRWDELIEPFVIGSARIQSTSGGSAFGEFVVVPRTSAELRSTQPSVAHALVREAVELARSRGAEIVGLGGQVSVVTGAGVDLGDMGVRLTTGNTFTALSALDAMTSACDIIEVAPAELTAGVLGAGGSVGRALSLMLAREFGRLVLVGNPSHPSATLNGLRLVASRIVASLLAEPEPGHGPIATRVAELADGRAGAEGVVVDRLVDEGLFILSTDTARDLPLADVLGTATSSTGHPLRAEHLKAGAIVCDIARPLDAGPAVALERPDVLILEGGLVEIPGARDLGWDFGLPSATAFACMCEPMMFALERRYDLAPVGVDTPPELLATLATWAETHGFRTAPFRTFGRPVTDNDWRRVREARREPMAQAAAAGAPHTTRR
jgi:acetylornithine/succinyldiaminopimelate/putrescine aminotransferase/acyl-CoA synthetase (AMP-forming)/AMP-acid ligase II/predicted amino acid dehydrogenase/acyl carrier protein